MAWARAGRRLSPPGPHLGTSAKNHHCSGSKEVFLGLKELELMRVELGLIKS